MFLYPNRFLSLRQYMQQIIIRQEEEPRELELLRVQVFIQTFSYLVYCFVALTEILICFVLVCTVENQWLLHCLMHYHAPFGIN